MATSRSTWQSMERHIARLLKTSRQFGQSAKGSRFKDQSMLGDVKTEIFLIECKLRDYAPKSFRKKHPRKFYPLFRVQKVWWTGIKKEADQSKRKPVLVVKSKYSQDGDMVAILAKNDLSDITYAAGTRSIMPLTDTAHKVLKSSVKLVLSKDGLPWEFEINGDCLVALPFDAFLEIESAWRGDATSIANSGVNIKDKHT
jgi:hypothetical protein